jgi:hypothetical protein
VVVISEGARYGAGEPDLAVGRLFVDYVSSVTAELDCEHSLLCSWRKAAGAQQGKRAILSEVVNEASNMKLVSQDAELHLASHNTMS